MDNVINIDTIVQKLINHGIIHLKKDGSFNGIFSFKRHAQLLTHEELDVWCKTIQCHNNCNIDHAINFQPIND